MKDDAKIRALDVCLTRIQLGEDLEEALGVYPNWSTELQAILHIAEDLLNGSTAIVIPAHLQAQDRNSFLEAAGELIPLKSRPVRERRLWPLLVIAALLLLIALVVSPTLRISTQALPGDLLYPLKIARERARLSLARDPAQRLALELTSDQERSAEVRTLIARSKSREVNFSGGLAQKDTGEWQVGEFRVLIPADTQMVGKMAPGFIVGVQGELRRDGAVVARRIQAREYDWEGVLESMEGDQWLVAGVPVQVGLESVIYGEPEVSRQVFVIAWLTLERNLLARLVEVRE